MRDRDRDAALGRAVELRQRDPGHSRRLREQPRLLEAVLARGRVHDEQRLVRRALDATGDDPPHLREFLHQVPLGMKSARRVDENDVLRPRAPRLDRVEGDGGRVRTARASHEVGTGALRPDLELLLGCGPECVCGADQHGAVVLGELSRELPDGRRLASSVDADHEDHGGPLRRDGEHGRCAEQRLDLVCECRAEIGHGSAGLQSPDELCGRRDADVRANQRLLEALPGLLVGRVERRAELGHERAPALRERVA